ncbi:hypothetical protein ONZ45_g18148 [Pleurotus djamor]|nr:hypothetical protein ONZ45_g18148 [Pleurotus djamor]
MAKSKKTNGDAPAPSSPILSETEDDRPTGPLSIVVPAEEREVIKVNNSNLSDLKNACDDAMKRYLSRPTLFNQIHLHTDVRLALGWSCTFVAAGTAFYGYKVDFEKSKPVLWAGLIVYFILTTIQTLYGYFIEGDIVFVGKRKTFSKRIVTERITIATKTIPSEPSSPPKYDLSVSYVRSTNGGKSLLARGKMQQAKEYSAFFDESGVLHQEVFEQWVGKLVEQGMEGKTA